jgi:SAM-dependent methyltransferase
MTIKNIKARIVAKGDQNDASVTEQLTIVDQLMTFGFEQFLLKNQGLNGFWTQHMVLYPKWSQALEKQDHITDFERWMLEKMPLIRSTQNRFIIFQELIQDFIKKHPQENIVLASPPCGLMDDLLTLDLPRNQSIKLIGIDLDQHSLIGARENAKRLGLESRSEFRQMDAWKMHVEEQFDLLTSNGLNIYEEDNGRVTELYKKFYVALKPNGVLVTCFLTPPPWLDPASSWEMKNINQDDLLRQNIINSYIVQPKWQAYRTEASTLGQLNEAGFRNAQIIYDEYKVFPTVLAFK